MAKILVVDDSPTQLTNLVKMVENQGHEAITASNGLEGIEQARAQKPDLIPMDEVMPELKATLSTGEEAEQGVSPKSIAVCLSPTRSQGVWLAFSPGAFVVCGFFDEAFEIVKLMRQLGPL